MKTKLAKMLFALAVCGVMSCHKTVISVTEDYDIGGAGKLIAINMATNDTIEVPGGISINIGGESASLSARNGNIIKLMFEPAKKYENYKFDTNYLLHDSTEIKNKAEYEYVIENTEPGTYVISMSAIYNKDDISISSGGSFNLLVKE